MGRKRRMRIGEGLSRGEAFGRVYPEVGKVDTIHDIDEIINAIENDKISNKLKRQRLQFQYSLTFSKNFKSQFKGGITEARAKLKRAYKKYVKK